MKSQMFCIRISTIKRIIGYPLLFFIYNTMISHSLNSQRVQELIPNGTLLVLLSSVIVFLFISNRKETFGNQKLIAYFIVIYSVVFFFAILNGAQMEITKVLYLGISCILLYNSNLKINDIIGISLIYGISSLYMLNRYHSAQINSLGIIVTFGIVCLVNFIDHIIKKRKPLIFSVLAIAMVILIAATGMRGAIAAVIILFMYTIIKELDEPKKKVFAAILIPIVLLFTWQIIGQFLSVYLFFDKWGHGNITTGRNRIWSEIFSTAGLFGSGAEYIQGYAHAHNTIMHCIGRYGYLFILLIFPFVIRTFKCIKVIFERKSDREAFYRMALVWVALSITETIDFVAVWLYGPQFILLVYLSALFKQPAIGGSDEQYL